MSDKEPFFELKREPKISIARAINQLLEVAKHPEFNDLKDWYKARVFDAMKKLTQIKDEL